MDSKKKTGFEALAKKGSLYPQESPVKTSKSDKTLFIGIPKEIALQENRVSLTPEAVAVLVNNGHTIWVETGAGKGAQFYDNEYSEAGAKIVYARKEVFEADIVLKVEPPTLEEIGYFKPYKTLISALQLGSQTATYIQEILKKRLTSIAFELLEDKVGGMPLVRAMSEIAGSTVMSIAAEYLNSFVGGKGMIVGGITGVPPTKVVILGAGTVAEYASRSVLGLGAQIQVFDNQIYRLRRLKHLLNNQIYTATIDTVTLSESLKTADVVIGALRAEKGRNRCVITEEMVAEMKPGSIIIDVSIDQGGCIETSELTTHHNPVFRKYNIIHYCVPNVASRVARTATTAVSNIFTPVLLRIADLGSVENMIFNFEWFMKGVYTYKGNLTNAHIAQKFKLNHKELNLLMAAHM